MNGIKQAAYFSLCDECGGHGHIVCGDGMESHEFLTVHGGLKKLAELILLGKITWSESSEMEQEIQQSGLEYRNDEIEAILEKRGKKSALGQVFDQYHRERCGVPPRFVSDTIERTLQ